MKEDKLLYTIDIVRAVFGAQAQQAGDSGPKDPQQWIYREWVVGLGLDRVNVIISEPCNNLSMGIFH